mmetsp:Transcript_4818/g.8729  ORF Transcript_4818/g.8729 Transcript_4818/m.8729 type:complete len:289 (-) Transcript_4818:633-1499(-)
MILHVPAQCHFSELVAYYTILVSIIKRSTLHHWGLCIILDPCKKLQCSPAAFGVVGDNTVVFCCYQLNGRDFSDLEASGEVIGTGIRFGNDDGLVFLRHASQFVPLWHKSLAMPGVRGIEHNQHILLLIHHQTIEIDSNSDCHIMLIHFGMRDILRLRGGLQFPCNIASEERPYIGSCEVQVFGEQIVQPVIVDAHCRILVAREAHLDEHLPILRNTEVQKRQLIFELLRHLLELPQSPGGTLHVVQVQKQPADRQAALHVRLVVLGGDLRHRRHGVANQKGLQGTLL